VNKNISVGWCQQNSPRRTKVEVASGVVVGLYRRHGLVSSSWACIVVVGLYRRLAHCIVVGLVLSSLGLPHRRWARRVVIGLAVLSLGSPCCRWARHVVVGLAVLSLGSLCCHWACSVVIGLPCCRWARRVVVGLAVLSLGLQRCHWASGLVIGPATLLFSLLHHRRWACHVVQLTGALCNSFCDRTSWVPLC